MYDVTILEEELKKKVAKDFFSAYDTTQNLGRVDFAVALPQAETELKLYDTQYFLWAEAKRGNKNDLYNALTQLIITIGQARTFNDYLPPYFLAAFDAQQIVFVEYDKIQDIFYQNDFNWNVTPSDHKTKEFALVRERVFGIVQGGATSLSRPQNDETCIGGLARQGCRTSLTPLIYDWEKDSQLLQKFIKQNFTVDNSTTHKVRVTFNNMTHIFNRWLEEVAPTIKVNWAQFEKEGILACDFFLADVLSRNNLTMSDTMKVLLRETHYQYKVAGKVGDMVMDLMGTIAFTDNQQAHTRFWARYERPPMAIHRRTICERRDLLVPPDRRERKGAFFTPHKWVDLSQRYLTQVLGENWQDEYFVWDCCAGTGNLLYGLYNPYNIYASTLDDADVRTMQTQKNLLPSHVFQFDFLNDDLQSDKVPASLREILSDPEKRKKLVIYINPPYAEATNSKSINNSGKQHKEGVAITNAIYKKYAKTLYKATNELFTYFFLRVHQEIEGSILAEFSTLKILQGPSFQLFRQNFPMRLENIFVVPAYTFDNVTGKFPIGFKIWNTAQKEKFVSIESDVYDENGEFQGSKTFYQYDHATLINKWFCKYYGSKTDNIGLIRVNSNDFQQQQVIFIANKPTKDPNFHPVAPQYLIETCIYFTIRHCIEHTWLNHNDQILYPNNGWETDTEFQSDCLVYTLFHGKNVIQSKYGTNHWIPFTEKEVNAKERFESHFMSDFLQGKHKEVKISSSPQQDLFAQGGATLSSAAQKVMTAGRALWRYYHEQASGAAYNPNASFYDIRLYFQGTDVKGKMNNKSEDEHYNTLLANLRTALKDLAKQIEPKVYQYGFLLGE